MLAYLTPVLKFVIFGQKPCCHHAHLLEFWPNRIKFEYLFECSNIRKFEYSKIRWLRNIRKFEYSKIRRSGHIRKFGYSKILGQKFEYLELFCVATVISVSFSRWRTIPIETPVQFLISISIFPKICLYLCTHSKATNSIWKLWNCNPTRYTTLATMISPVKPTYVLF